MAKKVLLHVGCPKTGTTHLQDFLFEARDRLAGAGLLYPADRFDEHFLAALDLMELPWEGLEGQAVGAWDRLADQVRRWPGTAIVSHEILARASQPQVERALASFGDAEIHLVVSARDLVRQIPAEYQENVKHRRVLTYEKFLGQLVDPGRTGNVASWFWAVQDVPDLLDRWAADLPADRVHLITVPHRGVAADVLPQRFAEVFGIDGAELAAHASRTNPSLGAAETGLLRRLNLAVVPTGLVPNRHYRPFIRELLAHQTLSGRTESERLGLPPDVHAWAAGVCDEWVAELSARGYHVVGDLEELRAGTEIVAAEEFADPDHPDEAKVADAALDALVALLQELGRAAEREEELRRELHLSTEDVSFVERIKRRVVRMERTSPVVRRMMRTYRRLRRR